MPAPRRTLPLLGLGVVLALSVVGCTVDASAPEAPVFAAAADSPEYLWALSAADGSLVGTDDEDLYLHLTGVGEAVTRFSDRPDRLASAVDLSDFLGRWDGRFSDEPPNAVLSYQPDGAGVQQQIVVTLSRPRWDDATRSLVFAADRIRKEADDLAGTEHPLDPALIDNPVSTGPVAVFVDGAGDVGANGTVEELAADGSAQVLEALEQMRANGFSERATTMANDVSRLHLLLGELFIARDGLARAISAGAAPAADVSAVLREAGISVSSPPTQADATALDAKIDEIRDTIGLDSSRLQELVEQEDRALEAQAAIVEKLREAASSLLDRTGL